MPHRIVEILKDCQLVFGGQGKVVLAREITKTFETVQGAEAREDTDINAEAESILLILLKDLPVKQAAALAANITGLKKNALYQFALELKSK